MSSKLKYPLLINSSFVGCQERGKCALCEELCGVALRADAGCIDQVKASTGAVSTGHLPALRLAEDFLFDQLALLLGHVFE